jgi:hypothetical protein
MTLKQQIEDLLTEFEENLYLACQPFVGPPGPEYFEHKAEENKAEILRLLEGK